MRRIVAVLLAVSCLTSNAVALQSGAAKPAPAACSLLTKELLAAHTPASTQSFTLMMQVPAQEGKIGTGSSCEYGGVMLQVDPFPVANFERLFGKYTSVAGVGERAYFHDNKGRWAELAVLAGGRMVTIQMGVPTEKTAASIQPNTVALAKAILAKLK
jgi:hypothetical protein